MDEKPKPIRDEEGRRTYALPSFDQLNMVYGVSALEKLFLGEYNNTMSQYYIIYFKTPPEDINTVAQEYSALPEVESVEVIKLYQPLQTFPNDPLFNFEPDGNYWEGAPNVTVEQWYLYNDGDMDDNGQSDGTVRADIHAPEAWDIQAGSPSVIIGILDFFLQWDHPDIKNNLWTNPGEEGNPDGYFQNWLSDDEIGGIYGDQGVLVSVVWMMMGMVQRILPIKKSLMVSYRMAVMTMVMEILEMSQVMRSTILQEPWVLTMMRMLLLYTLI